MQVWAYMFEHEGSDPTVDRLTVERHGMKSIIVGLPNTAAAPDAAKTLVDEEGASLIELCGGFTTQDVAAVVAKVGPAVAVGNVTFTMESIKAAADYQNGFD